MPKVFKLTQRTVEALGCPPGRKDSLVFDGELRGFGVRCTSGGGKVFLAQYSVPAGKRRIRIGPFGVLTAEEARREALGILGSVARGGDPFLDTRAKAEAARQAKADDAYTFGRLVEAWALAREGDRRASYLREAVACLTRNLPEWQNRPAGKITIAEAVAALDGLKARKGAVAANRTLAYARAAYSWAVKRQRLKTNPMKGIERPGREKPRERVLAPSELGAIWRASGEITNPMFAAFVRVLMLTLQRREEVGAMQWAELDDPQDPKLWTVPGERAKNGKAHLVHLSEPVRATLRALPAVKGNQHVFAGRQGKPISAFGFAKDAITTTLEKEGVLIEDWRFHDFRRAGVTALAGKGFAPHVCDRLLNHITGSIQGVAAIYQRHEFLAERKSALDAWAALVLAAADRREPAVNVVSLVRVAG
jgi:integrase